MPALNNTQLSLLRTKPQTSNFFLYPIIPHVDFAAQINDAAITIGAVVITFDNVTAGVWTNIVAGETLYVGSAPGLYDVARIRIRGATASTITVAENADVVWADNLFLTVIKQWLPWGVRPRITGGVVYKDYNIAYTDQTDKWPPVAMMGDPAIKFFDTNPTNVYFDGAESYAVAQGATISTHAWAFDDGGTSTAATPGNHGYTAAGDYWPRHTVTDSNGKTHTTYRPVCVINRSSAYVNFRCDSMSGGIDAGWTAKFTVFGDAPLSAFPERAPIFFFSDDNFGSNAGSVGFPNGRENVLMFGYIQEDSVTKNPETGDITFDVAGIARAMERISMYPATTQDKATPAAWTEAKNLNIFRSFVFLLKFHTTVMDVTDVFLYNDTTPIRVTNFPEDNLWNMFAQFAKGARMMRVGATRTGRVVLGRDPNLVPIASRGTIPVVMQLAQGDWVGQVTMPEQPYPLCAYLCLGGLTYDAIPADESNPLFGMSPGRPNKEFGDSREIHFLQLASQTEVNTLAGLALGQINNAFGEVVVEMAGNWTRAFDPALQEYVQAPSSGWVSKRGTLLTNQFMIVRKVEFKFNWPSGYVNNVLTCEVYSYPDIGVNGDCFTTDAPLAPTPPPIVIVPPVPPNPTGPGAGAFLNGIWTLFQTGDIYRLNSVTPGGGDATSKPSWKTSFFPVHTPYDIAPSLGQLVNVMSTESPEVRVEHSENDAVSYRSMLEASAFTVTLMRRDPLRQNSIWLLVVNGPDGTTFLPLIAGSGVYNNTSIVSAGLCDFKGDTGAIYLLRSQDGGGSWISTFLAYLGQLWVTQITGLTNLVNYPTPVPPGNPPNSGLFFPVPIIINQATTDDPISHLPVGLAAWTAILETPDTWNNGGPGWNGFDARNGGATIGVDETDGTPQTPLGYWYYNNINIRSNAGYSGPNYLPVVAPDGTGQYAFTVISGSQMSKNQSATIPTGGPGIVCNVVLNPVLPSGGFTFAPQWSTTREARYAYFYKVHITDGSKTLQQHAQSVFSPSGNDDFIAFAVADLKKVDFLYILTQSNYFMRFSFVPITITWTYPNAAARIGAGGFTPSDIGKYALQSDNNTIWQLLTVTPTWDYVSGPPVDLNALFGSAPVNLFCTTQGTILVGTADGKVHRSNDRAQTWSNISVAGSFATFFATEYHGVVGGAVGPIVVPLGSSGKYVYSLDDGQTWYTSKDLTVHSTVLSNYAR